jgi:hypothetical protein
VPVKFVDPPNLPVDRLRTCQERPRDDIESNTQLHHDLGVQCRNPALGERCIGIEIVRSDRWHDRPA